jgi:hypothetical protein
MICWHTAPRWISATIVFGTIKPPLGTIVYHPTLNDIALTTHMLSIKHDYIFTATFLATDIFL